MSRRKELLKKIDLHNKKAKIYKNIAKPSFLNKIKKLFLLKHKYVFYSLIKLFHIKKDLKVNLFSNKQIKLPSRDYAIYPLYFFGSLGDREFNLTKFLIKNLQPNDIFYDIGANYGFYSILAEEIITTGQIHTFEPNPDVFKYLQKNCDTNITSLNNVALNQTNTRSKFYIPFKKDLSQSGYASITKPNLKAPSSHYKKVTVSSITLDYYCKNNKPPTIIKLDVEGSELLVLNGGEKTIKNNNPLIIMEVWGNKEGKNISKQAIEKLKNLDYKIYKIDKNGDLLNINKIHFNKIDDFDNYVFKK